MCAQWTRLAHKIVLLAMLVSLAGVTVALAAGGDLDFSFGGGDGVATTDLGGTWNDELKALALQPDGKIVAVGTVFDPAQPDAVSRNIAIVRYENDGDPDMTFSDDSRLVVDLPGYEEARDVAMASGGRIVVSGVQCEAGGGNCDLVVARLNGDGNDIDPNFNGGEEVYIDFMAGNNPTAGGLAVTATGKIVIAGVVWNGTDFDFAVYRLKANGGLDRTFSGDGKAKIGFGEGKWDMASDLVLQPDGKIVTVGMSCEALGDNCKFAVARLNSNGRLDTTFSGDGKQATPIGDDGAGLAAARGPNGTIVVAGASFEGSGPPRMTVARYKSNGNLDRQFSGDGIQVIDLGFHVVATDLVVYGSGKVVLAGYGSSTGTETDVIMARLKAGGGMDDSFGSGGISAAHFADDQEFTAVVRQPDGKYVAGGFMDNGAFMEDFVVVRVLP